MGPVAVDSTAMVRLAVDDTNKGQAVDIQTEDSDWPQKLRSENIVRSRSGAVIIDCEKSRYWV